MTDEVKEQVKKEKAPVNNKEKKKDVKANSSNKDKGEIKQLKEENLALKKQCEELVEKVKLAQAELINYRKRKDDEISAFKKYCNQDIITDLIPVIDSFERAIKLDDNDLTDELSKFLTGFKMMYASLMEVLKKYGVTEISRQGEPFDSNLEEALMTDNLDNYEDDVVTEVLLKGYKLIDRVIRPASVKINKQTII